MAVGLRVGFPVGFMVGSDDSVVKKMNGVGMVVVGMVVGVDEGVEVGLNVGETVGPEESGDPVGSEESGDIVGGGVGDGVGHHESVVGGSVATGVVVAIGVVRACDVAKVSVDEREAEGNVGVSGGVSVKIGGTGVVTRIWLLLTVVARIGGSTVVATKAAQNMCWSALITMPLMLQSGWLAIWVWTRHVHSASISGAVSAS